MTGGFGRAPSRKSRRGGSVIGRMMLLTTSWLASGCLLGDPNPYDGVVGSGGAGSGGTGSGGTSSGGGTSTTPGLRSGSPVGSSIAPGSECSTSSTTGVRLVFSSTFGRDLSVFWVDYGCAERAYGSLAAGGRFETTTYATHPWRLRDATTNELLFEYVASETPEQTVSLP